MAPHARCIRASSSFEFSFAFDAAPLSSLSLSVVPLVTRRGSEQFRPAAADRAIEKLLVFSLCAGSLTFPSNSTLPPRFPIYVSAASHCTHPNALLCSQRWQKMLDLALIFATRSVRRFAYGLMSVILFLYLKTLGFSEFDVSSTPACPASLAKSDWGRCADRSALLADAGG